MKRLIVLLAMLLALPVGADAVTLVLYAKDGADAVSRPDLVGKGSCAEVDGSAYDETYLNNEAGCTGAGKEWIATYDMMYSQGMIVTVWDDSTQFPTVITTPPINGGTFVRVRITDKTKEQAIKYMENHENFFVSKRRRKWRVLVENLPVGVRQQLNQTGYYETDWATVRGFIYDLVNDVTE